MGFPRVLLADDAPGVIEVVSQLLHHHFHVVGSAQNGKQALDAVASLNPDIVVLDISMPVLNGIQVAARLQDSGCTARIVFLTVNEDQDYIDAAFSAGAYGYVLKSRIALDLIPAIQRALQGYKFTSLLPSATAVRGRRASLEPAALLVPVPEAE